MSRSVGHVDGQVDSFGGSVGFKERAFLWRLIALLQFPVAFLSMFAVLFMWINADIIIQVPQRLRPGAYSVKDLSDNYFIDLARDVLNLVSSYQPERVDLHYEMARKYLYGNALVVAQQFVDNELPKIKEKRTSRLFYVNPTLTKVVRDSESEMVTVVFVGQFMESDGGVFGDPVDYTYSIAMKTIPKGALNNYGIVVTEIKEGKLDSRRK